MLRFYNLGFTLSEINFLPPKKSSEQAEDFSPNSSTDKSKCLVLVLSSDRDTRILFKTALEIWNYETVEADSFEDLFCIIGNKSPDLVLLDAGFSFSESLLKIKLLRINNNFKDVPFILFSGYVQDSIREFAKSSGSTELCFKPVNFIQLEFAVYKCLKSANKQVSGEMFEKNRLVI